MEPNCEVILFFPAEMPATTDIVSVQGNGIYSTTTGYTGPSLNSVTFTSCSSWSEQVGANGQFFLNKAKAIGYVA